MRHFHLFSVLFAIFETLFTAFTAQATIIIELPRTQLEDRLFAIKQPHKFAAHDLENGKCHSYGCEKDTKDPFPHQYNIEIRKRRKKVDIRKNKVPGPRGPVHFLTSDDTTMDNGKGVREGREKHVDRDLEMNKYRMVENKAEEHWHEKKWHKEDLKEEYVDGKPVPVKLQIKPKFVKRDKKEEEAVQESKLPFYARSLGPLASKQQVDQHFAIPSPGFRVDQAFESWVKKDVIES